MIYFILRFILSFENLLEIEPFREMEITIKYKLSADQGNSQCQTGINMKTKPEGMSDYFELSMLCDHEHAYIFLTMNDFYNEDKFHKNDFQIEILIVRKDSPNEHKLVPAISVTLNMEPNSKYTHKAGTQNEATVEFELRCHLFTGNNCAFPAIQNKNYMRDPVNGKAKCVDSSKCGDERCEDDSYCNKKGKCYRETNSYKTKYCVCNKGWMGFNCEFEPVELTDDEILNNRIEDFIDPVESTDCEQCPYKICFRVYSFQICKWEDAENPRFETGVTKKICGPEICKTSSNPPVFFLFGIQTNPEFKTKSGASANELKGISGSTSSEANAAPGINSAPVAGASTSVTPTAA